VAWLDRFAEFGAQEDPVGSRVRRGRAEIGELWDSTMAAFVSIEITPRDIFVVGNEAAMEWTINAGTAQAAVTFDGVDVFTFDDVGRIASVRAHWERARVAEQRSNA
jgi:steroid delta-isomerase